MFWKTKKPVVLHCYTDSPIIFNAVKPEKTTRFIPKWFKQLPEALAEGKKPTVKNCPGFLDAFRLSISLPLWCDYEIVLSKEGWEWRSADTLAQIEIHNPEQWGDIDTLKPFQHFKIKNPWAFKCEEDIKFFLSAPTFWFAEHPDIEIVSGVLDFKYQNMAHIQIFAKIPTEGTIRTLLPGGHPVAQLTPLTERPVQLVHHLVSAEEYRNLLDNNRPLFFAHKYKKTKQLMKKCPIIHEHTK